MVILVESMVFSLDQYPEISSHKAFSRRQENEQVLTQSSKLGEGEEEELPSVFRETMVQTEACRTWYPIDLPSVSSSDRC